MNGSCPIEYKNIDANLVKINAIIIFSLIATFVLTQNPIVIWVVLFDFSIRVFFGVKYSPFCFLIKKGLKVTGIKPELINAGPKSFAAKIGLILSAFLALSILFGLSYVSMIISIIFLVASGLEAFFNVCLACIIYPYYKRFFS